MLATYILLYIAINVSGFLLNLSRMLRMKKYSKSYLEWLATGNSKVNLSENQQIVKDLVVRAGKGGLRVPVSQAMGYGQIASFSADPFLAFPNRIEAVAYTTINILDSCIGIYRSRMWNSFNPLYWIGMLLLLPKHVLIYLGVSGDKVIVKILNVLWWAFTTLVTGVIVKENSKVINDFIINHLK